MIDDVQSFVAAAEVLKERGAYKIYVLATHGLLSSDAPSLLEASLIDEASYNFYKHQKNQEFQFLSLTYQISKGSAYSNFLFKRFDWSQETGLFS